jgi:hypothetical protein
MAKHKFPATIHVTQEEESKGETFLLVFDIDEDRKPIAIYKLVEVGEVAIMKSFVSKGPPKNTQRYKSPVGGK